MSVRRPLTGEKTLRDLINQQQSSSLSLLKEFAFLYTLRSAQTKNSVVRLTQPRSVDKLAVLCGKKCFFFRKYEIINIAKCNNFWFLI